MGEGPEQRKKSGRSRTGRTREYPKYQSAPVSPKEDPNAYKAKCLPTSPTKVTLSPSTIQALSPVSTHTTPRKRNHSSRERLSVKWTERPLERDLSSQRKPLLKPLFKCTSLDYKPTEDPRNFLKTPGVTTPGSIQSSPRQVGKKTLTQIRLRASPFLPLKFCHSPPS